MVFVKSQFYPRPIAKRHSPGILLPAEGAKDLKNQIKIHPLKIPAGWKSEKRKIPTFLSQCGTIL
jgi:hypothetical protein